jgi:hypothetical protein
MASQCELFDQDYMKKRTWEEYIIPDLCLGAYRVGLGFFGFNLHIW